jgi:predicted alpha/beta-hydrolase family hydrolase
MAAKVPEGLTERLAVPTPVGEARVTFFRAPGEPNVLLVAGHGAGGGIEARDLAALARKLPGSGVTVALVEQPWRVAGKRLAPAPKVLDQAWLAVLGALASEPGRLVVAGRSAGARVACRTARAVAAEAVVALAFPLHPPGRPERSRVAELREAGVPVLVVQGERDTFGGPGEFPEGTEMVVVPDGDHGFAVRKSAPVTQDEALDVIAAGVREWLARR